jgi:PAS domain S-box-containing protein
MQTSTHEAQRLAALDACRILDNGPEPVFDRLTRLAAQFFSAPIAVISLVGRDRVVVKSGLGLNVTGMSRDGSFCAYTLLGRDAFVIPDAARDSRFADSPIVRESPAVRFYAGMPLIVSGDFALGTLAIMDTSPRLPLTESQLAVLRDLAAFATEEMERHAAAHDQPGKLSGELLAGIAGALPAMVWATDTAGNCTLLNRFEWDDAAPGRTNGPRHGWLDVIQRDGQDNKADLNCECRITGADGNDRWVLEQARPRFHADGSFAGYVGLCLDITDRKRTEEALRETQEWLSLAQGAGGIGLWDWDLVNDTVKCSDQLYRLYGREPGSLLRYRDWEQCLHPDERKEQIEYNTRVLAGQDEYDSEFRCVWPDGSVHWLGTRAKVYRDESGRAVRALGANIDISGFKEAEERRNQAELELLASREQLRQLAAHVESTREQERIRIAREIHDELGQILTVLKMDLEAIAARYRTSVARPLKDITRRISSMLANIESSIDTVRRISTELRPGVLDHLGIAAALGWQLQEFESRTHIRCRAIGLPEQLPLDARQSTAVFRIFQEILTNIARHADATSVKVEVESDAERVTLKVADNGRGFDSALLADPEALGLLGMQERALLFGGSIEFQSQPGAGATVILRIPVSRALLVSAPSAG